MGGRDIAAPILVTGAAGRVGGIGRTVTELLSKQFLHGLFLSSRFVFVGKLAKESAA